MDYTKKVISEARMITVELDEVRGAFELTFPNGKSAWVDRDFDYPLLADALGWNGKVPRGMDEIDAAGEWLLDNLGRQKVKADTEAIEALMNIAESLEEDEDIDEDDVDEAAKTKADIRRERKQRKKKGRTAKGRAISRALKRSPKAKLARKKSLKKRIKTRKRRAAKGLFNSLDLSGEDMIEHIQNSIELGDDVKEIADDLVSELNSGFDEAVDPDSVTAYFNTIAKPLQLELTKEAKRLTKLGAKKRGRGTLDKREGSLREITFEIPSESGRGTNPVSVDVTSYDSGKAWTWDLFLPSRPFFSFGTIEDHGPITNNPKRDVEMISKAVVNAVEQAIGYASR